MRFIIVLLILSIIGNFIGLFILYKFMKKNEYLAEVEANLKRKDEVLAKVNSMLPKRLVFIHHSVGRNWLNDGLRDELISQGISVQSITRDNEMGTETDMNHWVPKFEKNLEKIISFDKFAENSISDKPNDIIMFKSCYPNSDVVSEGAAKGDPYTPEKTIANYRAVFDSLRHKFSTHPEQTFLYVTSPPMHRANTTAENAARARQFSNWIKTDFVRMYKEETGLDNFLVFDLFDVLADDQNFLKEEYVRREGDSHPNPRGNKAASKAFLEQFKNNL